MTILFGQNTWGLGNVFKATYFTVLMNSRRVLARYIIIGWLVWGLFPRRLCPIGVLGDFVTNWELTSWLSDRHILCIIIGVVTTPSKGGGRLYIGLYNIDPPPLKWP